MERTEMQMTALMRWSIPRMLASFMAMTKGDAFAPDPP